jgi:hypothetical protein
MVPARTDCPDDSWTREYSGYLMTKSDVSSSYVLIGRLWLCPTQLPMLTVHCFTMSELLDVGIKSCPVLHMILRKNFGVVCSKYNSSKKVDVYCFLCYCFES